MYVYNCTYFYIYLHISKAVCSSAYLQLRSNTSRVILVFPLSNSVNPFSDSEKTGSNYLPCIYLLGFPGDSVVKNPPAMQGMKVLSLGQEDPLEKEMATHSTIFALEIPGTEEPGGLQAVGSQVRDEWTTAAAAAAAKPLQSCPTLCDPIDGSPLGSSVPGILQARILEWVNNDKFTYLSNPLICNQSPNPPTKESSALWQPQGPPTQKGSGRASGLTLWLHSIVSVLWCSQELFTLSLIIFFFLKKFYWSTVDL